MAKKIAKAPLAMKEIFEAARSGDTILVYRVDRLGRNMKVFVPWLDKLSGRGIDVRSVTESLSYFKDREEFIERLRIAEAESEGRSVIQKDAHHRKKRNGGSGKDTSEDWPSKIPKLPWPHSYCLWPQAPKPKRARPISRPKSLLSGREGWSQLA